MVLMSPRYEQNSVQEHALAVLAQNTLSNGVISPNIPRFNGSFLWDTALIAEGLATVNPSASALLITEHLRGQHLNGMLPNEVIYHPPPIVPKYLLHYHEQSRGAFASNITQPPTIVTATWETAKRLPIDDRKEFLKSSFPVLQTYMGWLLTERTDSSDGLVMLTHPHESGMDDNPLWESVLEQEWATNQLNVREKLLTFVGTRLLPAMRHSYGDYQDGAQPERAHDRNVLLAFLQSALSYKLKGNPRAILDHGKGTVLKDVGFNALTAEANRSLINIESAIGDPWYRIDEPLYDAMGRLERSIESVHYNAESGKYHSINVRSGEFLPAHTASSLLPILTTRDTNRINVLIDDISDPTAYWTKIPVPSVRADSTNFDASRYWRGGSWSFLRYQIERGLRRAGRDDFAAGLRARILYNTEAGVCGEFNNPYSGKALGAKPFSPAAAELLLYGSINRQKS